MQNVVIFGISYATPKKTATKHLIKMYIHPVFQAFDPYIIWGEKKIHFSPVIGANVQQ